MSNVCVMSLAGLVRVSSVLKAEGRNNQFVRSTTPEILNRDRGTSRRRPLAVRPSDHKGFPSGRQREVVFKGIKMRQSQIPVSMAGKKRVTRNWTFRRLL